MKRKAKELAKIKKRRKLWSIMGWHWAYKRADGGHHKTEYTDDPADGKGLGFFRKNHSLNCGCYYCRYETYRKRKQNKVIRREAKQDIKNQF